MKSSSKWLIGFGAAIGTLIILAIVLVVTLPSSNETELPPEGTPEGVVMRYLKAIEEDDYGTAFDYLSEAAVEERELTETEWSQKYTIHDPERIRKIVLTDVIEKDSTAVVYIEIRIFRKGMGFTDPMDTYVETYNLAEIDGTWKIIQPLDIPWELRY